MGKKILLVPDGRPEKGFGHISRCLTLAKSFKKYGAQPLLFLPYDVPVVHAIDHGLALVLGRDPVAIARRNSVSHVVLDGYGFPKKYVKSLTALHIPVTVIDDLGFPRLPINLVVNPNMHATKSLYQNQCLLGPRYAFLRDEILTAQSNHKLADTVKHIIVCMGGADPNWVTRDVVSVLQRVAKKKPHLKITIILGPHSTQELHKVIADDLGPESFQYKLLIAPRNFADILASADLAIVSGGVVLTESLYLGIPCLAINLADNQTECIAAWCKLGAAISTSPEQGAIESGILTLFNSASLRNNLSQQAIKLIDGHGASRVAKKILQS
jgi:spore coat polysaccharide biosynthesis predicted glycosyltransferase SpsG